MNICGGNRSSFICLMNYDERTFIFDRHIICRVSSMTGRKLSQLPIFHFDMNSHDQPNRMLLGGVTIPPKILLYWFAI